MYILGTKNQIETNQVNFASLDISADPYDIDLVINFDLHNNNNLPTQPMSGGGGTDFNPRNGGGATDHGDTVWK